MLAAGVPGEGPAVVSGAFAHDPRLAGELGLDDRRIVPAVGLLRGTGVDLSAQAARPGVPVERLVVAAGQLGHVAAGLGDRRDVGRCHFVAERRTGQRPPVESRRIDVGVPVAGDVRGTAGVPERRLGQSAALEMKGQDARDHVRVRGRPALDRGGQSGMEGSPAGVREPLVGGHPDQVVPEANPGRVDPGNEVVELAPGIEVGRDIVVVEYFAEQLQVDRPAQDGGPPEQCPALPAKSVDPAGQERFQAVGQVLQAAVLSRRRRQLSGKQRVAARPLGDRSEIGVGQGVRTGGRECDPNHRVRLERRQVDPRRGGVAERPRAGPLEPDHQPGLRIGNAGQRFEQGERCLVGPVKVLEDQHGRRPERLPEQLDDRGMELATSEGRREMGHVRGFRNRGPERDRDQGQPADQTGREIFDPFAELARPRPEARHRRRSRPGRAGRPARPA